MCIYVCINMRICIYVCVYIYILIYTYICLVIFVWASRRFGHDSRALESWLYRIIQRIQKGCYEGCLV